MKHQFAAFHAIPQQRLIQDRPPHQLHAIRQRLGIPSAGQIVQHRYLRPQRLQRIRQMRSNEPRSTRDQNAFAFERRPMQLPPIGYPCHIRMLYSQAVRLMTSPVKTSVLPRAILFDMDGTLTAPILDFPRIKAEMAIGPGPILEAMAQMDDARRRQAEAVLHRHEKIAAENSRLNEGCRDLLAWLAANGLATALVTRNSLLSAQTVLQRHQLSIDVIITREDGPFKPSPIPLELACRRLAVKHDDAWMVGDGQHDVEAALAAGIRAAWISHGKPRPFDAQPWLTVADLPELTMILKQVGKDRLGVSCD